MKYGVSKHDHTLYAIIYESVVESFSILFLTLPLAILALYVNLLEK